AVAGTLQLAATGRERRSEVYAFLRLAPLGAALIGIGGLLTLGFGIALAQHQGIGFSAAWIQASLGLWVASMALGLYGGRMVPFVGARAPIWTSWASGLLLLAILGLAVWQPTGSAAPSYASSTVVPLHVQRAIARRFPQF